MPLSQYVLIDAHQCDLGRLSDLHANEDFVAELCKVLETKAHGDLLIANFGGEPDPDPRIHGPSYAQMLDRGLVQGHCPTHPRLACIDILSEGDFDVNKIEQLVHKFYKAEFTQTLSINRGIRDNSPQITNVYDTSRPHIQWEQHEMSRPNLKTSLSMKTLFDAFKKYDSWGQFMYVDLFDCDLAKITDLKHIESFNIELCEAIVAGRYGDPLIGDFDSSPDTKGLSFAQLIETSLVQGHFLEESQRGMIDLFSCRQFHAKMISDFAARYFGADSYSTATVLRGCAEQFPIVFHNHISSQPNCKWALNETES